MKKKKEGNLYLANIIGLNNALGAAMIFDLEIVNKTMSSVGEGITLSPSLNKPSSVGWLELASQNPFEQPKIFLNFFDKAEDVYKLISSLKLCREIVKYPPLTNWGAKDIGVTDEFGQWASDGVNMTDSDWERFIREKVLHCLLSFILFFIYYSV